MASCLAWRGSRYLAVVVALCAAAAAKAAGPEILNQVPGDAYGVVVVGNARALANKISTAATRIHLPVPPDVLEAMKRTIGITNGFNNDGSVALVLLKPAEGGGHTGSDYFNGMPPAVLLLPATNPSLMLEKFNPSDPDKDGISAITLPDNPEEKGFSAVVDKKWVALAQKKEDLAAYLARGESLAKLASAETLKVFDANDVVIWGNVQKLGAGADKWLDDAHADVGGMRDLTNFVQGNDALQSTFEKHGMGLVFDLSKQFFRDAGGSMLTVRLTDSGATLGLIAEFKPDTAMGKFVAAQAGGAPVSLKGLPAGNFLMAGAGKWNGESLAGVVRTVMNQIVNDPALAKDARLDDLRKAADALGQITQMTSGGSFTVLEPAGRGKDGYINGAFLVDAADPKKFVELELQMAGSALAQQSMNADIKTAVTVTPNALTVKDVPLAKMSMKMALREETPDKPIRPESKAGFDAVQRLYGANGLTMYMGAVGKRVIIIYGSDLNLMESAIAAAQSDADAVGAMPEVAATKDQLVANPVAVAYLPIARWVTLAQSIIRGGEGEAAPAAGGAGANVPPVVMSVGVSGSMVTMEVHVPIAAITATQDAFNRMQAGPGGGVLPNLP